MYIYMLLPVLNIFLYLFLSNKKNGKKIYLIVTLLTLMIISTLRSKQIGADYHVYIRLFENINELVDHYTIEKGYLYLNFLIHLFTNNYVIFSLIINIFIFGTLYYFITQYIDKKYYFWIMLIFILNPYLYIQSTFNVVRQMLSICIFLYGIKFLNEKENLGWKKYIIYFLISAIAAQFHKMCYIYMILLSIIKFVKWNEKKFIIMDILAVIANIFLGNSTLLYFIANIFGYGKYVGYNPTLFNFPIYTIFILLVSIALIYSYKKIQVKKEEELFLNTYIVSIILLPVFITNDIMYRIYIGLIYMSLPSIMIMLRYIETLPKKWNITIKIIFIMYYCLLYILFLSSVIKSNNTSYMPFIFFWQ